MALIAYEWSKPGLRAASDGLRAKGNGNLETDVTEVQS
jgi:hypothetical protein